MMLSKYFTLEEGTFSETATRLGIDNTPNAQQLANMIHSAKKLDYLREQVGPILVSSWLRVPELNAAVAGSSKASAHTLGFAIDCRAEKLPVLALCKYASNLYKDFDQIIFEYGRWMHISFAHTNRKQLLTIFKNNNGFSYKSGLLSQSDYLKA